MFHSNLAQEPRIIARVGLQVRETWGFRDDSAHVILANIEALPSTIIGATSWCVQTDVWVRYFYIILLFCPTSVPSTLYSINPGSGFAVGSFRNYNCNGSAPSRFVYIAQLCSTVGVTAARSLENVVRYLFLL